MTDFPHLFCHFLLFQFSTSSHLGSFVSPPLASFSHLSPAYSLASSRQQDSVGHSGPLGPWLPPPSSLRPSRSFRPTRSMACFSLSLASVQLGLSRSFRPTQSPAASVFVCTFLLSAPHHRLDSVGHSGPLGLWQLPRSSLLPSSPFFL